MTKLNQVTEGFNKFCGPAVLSILTGRSTDECARVIGRINGAFNITGVELGHLLKAADQLGFTSEQSVSGGSLYGTLVRLAKSDGLYIVTMPSHFVVIEISDRKAYFCDNHTKNPIPAASSARLGQSVVTAHKVFKKPDAVIVKPPKRRATYHTVTTFVCDECGQLGEAKESVLHLLTCESGRSEYE